ncbi:MAG: SAM-dependent methyltransferase [Chlorobi bacterium]|nr:SAM-dependent methyltransferase [Chlorobiota bacterium]
MMEPAGTPTETTDQDREKFLEMFARSIREGTLVKLTLGKYRGSVPGLTAISIQMSLIRETHFLEFDYRSAETTRTRRTIEEGTALVRELLGGDFRSGNLFTRTADYQIEYSKRLKTRFSASRPTFTEAPSMAHDREKRRLIETEGNIYLQRLGVIEESGRVKERMGDKFRQISRFIEIVAGLFAGSPLAERKELSIVDMGSGKGYLTFATYDHFTSVLGIATGVTGVEARPELVDLCNGLAEEAGFQRLRFRPGYIRDVALEDGVDILIALHACDTATDEAIHKGITAGAGIIICAPCCHKEIRPQIVPPDVLRDMLGHGIILEREAENITDTLRALLLEYNGYSAKVFEFISTEHTRKNTMIVGVRHGRAVEREKIMARIEALKSFYGIERQALETLLAGTGEIPPAVC